jgi:hypothetical protein
MALAWTAARPAMKDIALFKNNQDRWMCRWPIWSSAFQLHSSGAIEEKQDEDEIYAQISDLNGSCKIRSSTSLGLGLLNLQNKTSPMDDDRSLSLLPDKVICCRS